MVQLTMSQLIVSLRADRLHVILLTHWTTVATQSVDYLVNPVGFKKISKNDKPTAGTVTFSTYEGLKHETNPEELEDIQNW
jgi:predicted esterase